MSCKKKVVDPNKEDFNLELAFAKRLLKGEVKLKDFPYYKSYADTIKKEKKYLGHNCIVVGCGPLPLSMILLGEYADGFDISKTASSMARKMLNRVPKDTGLIWKCTASKFEYYGLYDSILLTLEAGTTLRKKEAILKQIYNNIQPNTIVVVRSSNTEDFVKSSAAIDTDYKFDIVDSFPIFNGMSTSYVIKKK